MRPGPDRFNPKILFERRIDSFKAGIDLLVTFTEKDHSVEDSLIRRTINELHKNLISELKETNPLSFKSGKKILQRFIQGASRLFSQYTDLDENKNADKIFELIVIAEKYAVWKNGRKLLERSPDKMETVTQSETPRVEWTDAHEEELLSISDIHNKRNKPKPAWFLKLHPFEQWYIKNKALAVEKAEDTLLSVPSTLRNIFGLANYSEHQLTIKDAQIPINSKRARSAVVVPADLLERRTNAEDEKIIIDITQRNIAQLIMAELEARYPAEEKYNNNEPKSVPILLQTLLSDGLYGRVISDERDIVKYKNEAAGKIIKAFENIKKNKDVFRSKTFLEDLGFSIEDDGKLKVGNKSIYIEIILSNIPINEARHGRYGGSRPKINAEILAIAENSEKSIVQAALTEYKDDQGTAGNNYNLFKASLEQIIIDQCGGISHGSCRSGKDRKTMEILHTDAMLVYYALYGMFPRHSDKKDSDARKNFVDIFVKLYFTYLHHDMADQNAPGSFGIKSIEGILPKDILSAIKEKDPQEIENNKKYSSLNRIKKRSVPKKLLEQDEQLVRNNLLLDLQKQRMACLKTAKDFSGEKLLELQNRYDHLTKIYDALREKELLAGRPLAYHRIDAPAEFKEIEALGENWLVSLEKTLFEPLNGIKTDKFFPFQDKNKNPLQIDPNRNIWWAIEAGAASYIYNQKNEQMDQRELNYHNASAGYAKSYKNDTSKENLKILLAINICAHITDMRSMRNEFIKEISTEKSSLRLGIFINSIQALSNILSNTHLAGLKKILDALNRDLKTLNTFTSKKGLLRGETLADITYAEPPVMPAASVANKVASSAPQPRKSDRVENQNVLAELRSKKREDEEKPPADMLRQESKADAQPIAATADSKLNTTANKPGQSSPPVVVDEKKRTPPSQPKKSTSDEDKSVWVEKEKDGKIQSVYEHELYKETAKKVEHANHAPDPRTQNGYWIRQIVIGNKTQKAIVQENKNVSKLVYIPEEINIDKIKSNLLDAKPNNINNMLVKMAKKQIDGAIELGIKDLHLTKSFCPQYTQALSCYAKYIGTSLTTAKDLNFTEPTKEELDQFNKCFSTLLTPVSTSQSTFFSRTGGDANKIADDEKTFAATPPSSTQRQSK